jgi:hypothetical protein
VSSDAPKYIKTYCKIYKPVILKAKQRHNNMLISCLINPTKTMWQLINKKTVISGYLDKKDLEKITHPQKVADAFNSYFTDKVEELVEQNRIKGINFHKY